MRQLIGSPWSGRVRIPGVVIAVLMLCVLQLDPAATPARFPPVAPSSVERPGGGVYRYTLTARVHWLFIGITRPNVGSARIVRNLAPENVRNYQLLIGSDPERAPMRINRWGYIAESVNGPSAQIVGVMTESDEQTAQAAKANLEQPGSSHPFKAIRATIAGGHARSDVQRVCFKENFTLRDVESVLSLLPAAGQATTLRVPDGTSPGFLSALDDLLRASVEAWNRTGKAVAGTTRRFVWDRGLFELTLRRANPVERVTLGSRTHRNCLTGDFGVRNLATGDTSEFELTYGTRDDIAQVPVRIVYGPRWWFEVELTLASGS